MAEGNRYAPPTAVVRDSPPPPRSPTLAVLAGIGVGGYVCARMVRRNERRVIAILASVIAGADLALAAILGESAWLEGFLLVMTVVCILAGGELGRRRNLAKAREANAAIAA